MSDERARIIIMPRLALYVLAVLAVIARGAESTSSSSFTYEYSSNLDLADSARRIVSTTCAKYGSIEVLGTSTEGVEVFAVRLRKENNNEGLPKVKIVGNLHGDEPTGRVLTLGLAEWLCGHVGKDERASLILSKVDLWLVPTVNPDGYALGRRGNSKDVDLNRDFPDRFDEGATSNWLPERGNHQVETRMIMDFIRREGPFVSRYVVVLVVCWLVRRLAACPYRSIDRSLAHSRYALVRSSLAIHEGALVANYPWDGSPDRSTGNQPSPDDATFRDLARGYASAHRKMSLASNVEFAKTKGITNGAAWYPIYGSMQDWNYVVAGCMELTLEVSEDKWPDESKLPGLFEDNLPAMLEFILRSSVRSFSGIVYGIHTNGSSNNRKAGAGAGAGKQNLPIPASVTVHPSFMNTTTDPTAGTFYRPLAPGTYTVEVAAEGFKPKTMQVEMAEDGVFVRVYLNMLSSGATTAGWLVVDPREQFQSGVIIVVGVATIAGGGLFWIHQLLLSRSSGRSLMSSLKILRR